MITGFGLIWQIMLFNVISANLQQKKVCERLILAINKNSFVRNFVFQVHTSSPLHWYLHWRRSKTREWWVELQPHKNITRMYKWTTENERFLLFPLQITVSSGGMLTQKLDVDDLQFEKGTFDGTMAYAQNKVEWLKDVAVYRGIVVVFILICIFFSLSGRGSRWSWQKDGLLSTKRSTSPACTPAGQTHQVKKRKIL